MPDRDGIHEAVADQSFSPIVPWLLPLGLGYGLLFHGLSAVAAHFEVFANVSLWYPPAGVRLALLLLFGWRFALIAFPAELAIGLFTGSLDAWLFPDDGTVSGTRITGMLVAAGLPPLAYMLAVHVADRMTSGIVDTDPIASVARVCLAGALGAGLAAASTTQIHAAVGFITVEQIPRAMIAFWIGDFIGTLTFTPALLLAGTWLARHTPPALHAAIRTLPAAPRARAARQPSNLVMEAAAVTAATVLLLQVGDGPSEAVRWYPLLLPIVWSAFRGGLNGAIVAGFAVNLVTAAIVAADPVWHDHDLEVFMIVASISGLLMGAVTSALGNERASLEQRVAARTRDLAEEIARRRHAEGRAIEERRRAETLLHLARTAIIACDRDGLVTIANDEACALTGRPRSGLLGAPFVAVVEPPDRRGDVAQTLDRLARGETLTFECDVARDQGDTRLVEWRGTPVSDAAGFLLTGVDITDRMQCEREMRHRATHDALTGVLNRTALPDHLRTAIARARRHGSGIAVAFADLNGFKAINDAFGHAAGDCVLVETARRLTAAVRDTDAVIRLGGDEFVLVLEDVDTPLEGARIGTKIARAVTRPIDCGEVVIRVGVAVGVACYPHHGQTAEHLLAAADAAMYARKRRSGSGSGLAEA